MLLADNPCKRPHLQGLFILQKMLIHKAIFSGTQSDKTTYPAELPQE